MNTFLRLLFTCILLIFSLLAKADFDKRRPLKVPLQRLIHNLERQKELNPDDAHAYYAVGRLLCMAYATKIDSVPAILRAGENEVIPYYGYDRGLRQFYINVPKRDSANSEMAKSILQIAVDNFQTAIRLDTGEVSYRLGLAWALHHMGDSTRAIQNYRAVLRSTERKDQPDAVSLESHETAIYLKQLLDSASNAHEIAYLNTKILGYKPSYFISPIVLPMSSSDQLQNLIDEGAKVDFDLDGSGYSNAWQWINKKAAWLVYLNKETDKVENAHQLFGNASFNIKWKNGFEALKSLDNNNDGLISGIELDKLYLWNDKNSNGICDHGELQSVYAAGIESLSTNYISLSESNLQSTQGVKMKDGSHRNYYDWWAKSWPKQM